MPIHLAPPIFDRDISVPPFAYQHFALAGRAMAALSFELKKPIVVPHHPVPANGALALQPENPV